MYRCLRLWEQDHSYTMVLDIAKQIAPALDNIVRDSDRAERYVGTNTCLQVTLFAPVPCALFCSGRFRFPILIIVFARF